MSETRLLYVMGRGHSGSTVLDALLGNGAGVVSVGELVAGLLRFDDVCSCGETIEECEFWTSVRTRLEAEVGMEWSEAAKIIQSQAHLSKFPATLVGGRQAVETTVQVNRAIIDAIAGAAGAELVVDSSKEFTRALLLARHDPTAKIIHLVRSPHQVLASLEHRMREGTGFSFLRRRYRSPLLTPLFMTIAAAGWFVGNLLGELVTAGARDRVLRVRYEDLCADSAGTLREVGRFIDVDFEPVVKAVAAAERLPLGHKAAGNRMRRGETFVFEPARAEGRQLSRPYAVLGTLVTWPLLLLYGYRVGGGGTRRARPALKAFHTARHLPVGQATAWLRRRMTSRRPRLLEASTGGSRSAAWGKLADAVGALDRGETGGGPPRPSSAPPPREHADRIVARRFDFVGVERQLSDIDWSASYVSPLWTYHLRYFDYAVDLATAHVETGEARYLDAFVELWTSWFDAAEAGVAGLEPYPTSVRCMNALRSVWLLEDRLPGEFADRLLAATHAQLTWLAGNLERHLRANHLQKNLTALAWGSLAFGGETAEKWARFRAELWEEMREQVLGDGGHFERSPMYHAHALDDFLRTLGLCRAAGVAPPGDVPGRLAAMTRALQWLSRPAGSLHLFNDSANGQGVGRHEVVGLARRVLASDFPEPDGTFALPESGYFGHVDSVAGARLVVDAGPPGPDYQPGHAHCDMLSFELDLAGRPVVVDAGVHGYDGDSYREYVRSTRAHNTVAIDGRDQHEMWATFRVARRGEIVAVHPGEPTGEGPYAIRASCRPYHDHGAVHHRLVELLEDGLTVTDRVAGAVGRPVTSWLHLHPDFRVEPAKTESRGETVVFTAVAADPLLRLRIRVIGADEAEVRRAECDPAQGWHCPEFGIARPASAIELRLRSNDGRAFGWHLTRATG